MSIDLNAEMAAAYEIVEEIGSGGGGIVYKAYHKRLQKFVVLKKIKSDAKKLLDSRIEADILKNLHHYYLPQVLDFLEINNDVYTVMDFIPGKSFADLIKEGHKFSPNNVKKYAKQICEAVAYLHAQVPPIIHGDIKPANIMLTPEDNICLIDFNISGFLTDRDILTLGYTEGYAAPEQKAAVESVKNAKVNFGTIGEQQDKTELLDENSKQTVSGETFRINQRADVYSIGATIYNLATGIKPNGSAEKVKNIDELVDGYSYGFAYVIEKAMSYLPDNRFDDAQKMLEAIKNIYKYDKNYKKLLSKQKLIYFLIIIFVGFSIYIFIEGRQIIRLEKDKQYDAILSQLSMAKDDSNEFEKIYQQACDYMPMRLDAAYEKAVYLSEKKNYQEAIEFIENNLINKEQFYYQPFAGQIYYLLGNDYFELGNYKEAEIYYQTAIERDGNVSQYYGEYAITLAYEGKTEKAEEVLQKGIQNKLQSDYVYLVNAEILAIDEKAEEAIEYAEKCVNITSDRNIKLRAYVLWNKMLLKDKTEQGLKDSVKLLLKAQAEVPQDCEILILESLAQDYIDLSTITGDTNYDQSAIDVFNAIVRSGWDNYITHTNLAILYEKQEQYEKAKKELTFLLETEPDNYIAYKRMAILEIDIQNNKKGSERNYETFEFYYNNAFQKYTEDNEDIEMQWLKQTMDQLKSSGKL